jgi:hypothetical protein
MIVGRKLPVSVGQKMIKWASGHPANGRVLVNAGRGPLIEEMGSPIVRFMRMRMTCELKINGGGGVTGSERFCGKYSENRRGESGTIGNGSFCNEQDVDDSVE